MGQFDVFEVGVNRNTIAGIGLLGDVGERSWGGDHGSWVEIALATHNGRHEVAEGGPRRLWRLVEHAHRVWTDLDRPGWDRFGLTVTPQAQTVWFDRPDSDRTWRLAAR
ncbi:hypothetical protein B0I33_105103 [Prauserella shujinwangii]|uniref:Uncharacterized protein n=1 Tax=Prauserella shujinwangii TaxID=1453103 RepID=A0A2T0LUL3_9PSEU|nr:hypothetical protein [Prauserella shujinwangii]PRX47525.1 hypothetical protein B0I33_105103 [Prauserella shujinwangii]